ncbi:MAG TPA: 4Fe-4S single cluster domain-containing protein [Pyrinomonadaceae bacterium]|jgi:anaerobic ribonucleoside-triphosphate reductase activating protein
MAEAIWIIDQETGDLTVEGLTTREAADLTAELLAGGEPINCGRPAGVPPLNASKVQGEPFEPTLRIYRVYHNSVVEGPGRRSVVQLAGCLLRCPGCYVPETHDPHGGVELTVSEVVDLLLDGQGEPRDGVTVLGGEPFLQPEGLAALLNALKERGLHVTLYTGYTLEALRARGETAVNEALAHADILIDGPFVAQLSRHAGEWRGSTNQRIIYQPAAAVAL